MYYNNINGLRSKSNSLTNIIKSTQPKIVALCETKLGNSSRLSTIFQNYELLTKFSKQGKGGLLIAIEKNYFAECKEVTNSPDENVMAVRLTVSNEQSIRLILAYGPQETQPVEEREGFMMEIEIELQRCVDVGDHPVLVGDLNAKLQMSNGELEHISANGKMLKEIIDQHQLNVMNFTEKCRGYWTHVIRTTGEESVLDYVITDQVMGDAVNSIVIDEECMLCPFRAKKKAGVSIPQYSDHNAVVVEMEVEACGKNLKEAEYFWKMDEDGSSTLRTITDADEYEPPNLKTDPQDNYNMLEDEMNKLMESAYRKRKKKNKVRTDHKVAEKYMNIMNTIRDFSQKGKVQRAVAKKYKDMVVELNMEEERKTRAENLSRAVKSMTIDGTFSSNEFWKAKRCIYSRASEIGTSVYNNEGSEVCGELLVSGVYKDEFSKRLEHRKIASTLKEYEERTNQLANLCISEAAKSRSPEITLNELNVVIDKSKKGAPGSDDIPPEFYKNCGEGFKIFLVDVLNELKRHVYCPEQWERTLIKTIYKNKGSKKNLKNYRGVFLTQVVSKIYERILFERIREILDKVSRLQAGSRSNRGPPDNLFLMKSCIDHARYLNIPVFITVYDFEQCFDALWLEDSIVSLWELGVRDDTLAILYSMNKKAKIRVKCPSGITDEFIKPSIVKQGTVAGPSMCSVSTAELIKRNRGVKGFPIGGTSIHSMVLVDDVGNINLDVPDVVLSHKNTTAFSRLKRLPLGGGKCFILPVNLRKKLEKELIPILKVGDVKMTEKEKLLYLGAMFNKKGNNSDLIAHRIQQARTCMINSIAMCTDITLGCYVFHALMLTYKAVFMQTLLYGASVWTNLTKGEVQKMQILQLQFLKRSLQVPRSTSNCVVYLELGVLPVIYEIHARKLTFLHHVLTLSEDDPVFRTYKEQRKYIMERNWANEIIELRETYELQEIDVGELSKKKWKRLVKKNIRRKALDELCKERATLSRATEYPEEKQLAPKKYLTDLNAVHARILFRLRCKNWDLKEWRQYMYEDMSCRLCEQEDETLEHVLCCCGEVGREPPLQRDNLNVYTEDHETQMKLVKRAKSFADLVMARKEEASDTTSTV